MQIQDSIIDSQDIQNLINIDMASSKYYQSQNSNIYTVNFNQPAINNFQFESSIKFQNTEIENDRMDYQIVRNNDVKLSDASVNGIKKKKKMRQKFYFSLF